MATKVRLELNDQAMRQAALLSPEVRAALRQIAEATATRARTMTNLEIDVREGGRTRATVHVGMLGPAAAATEAKHRVLGRALGGSTGTPPPDLVSYTSKSGKTSMITRKQAENYQRRSAT